MGWTRWDGTKGGVKRMGGGGGSKRVRPRVSYGPKGGTPGGIFSEPSDRPADREGRKLVVPQVKVRGDLSGIWDTLFMGLWR